MSINVLDSVRNVRSFMIGDLNKTAKLQKSPDGAPNFLLALALCCYTEYWGKLLTENKLSHLDSFNAFFEILGECYKTLIKKYGGRIYGEVRCGLAHYYLIEKSATINMGYGLCGVEYDGTNRRYTFNILTYLEDFQNAVDTFITEIETNQPTLKKVENALANKPLLT
jgi:hypothetical protein